MYHRTFQDRLTELWEDHSALLIAAAVMALLIVAGLARQWAHPVTSASQEQQTIIILATQQVPTATPQNGLQRAVVAYAAPDGQALGAIEPGRACALVARSGDAWLQFDCVGSGLVWIRAGDVGLAVVPDLATPVAPVVVVAPAAPIANEQPAIEPTSAPAPQVVTGEVVDWDGHVTQFTIR